MIFFVNKTLSCSLYHGKKKTHKTSGYSDNSERNINFKFDRLRAAVNCTIWSEWNFIHQKRTAEKTRGRKWNRTLQLSLFVPKIIVFMPIYGTRLWIQRKANIADVLVTELTGQNSYLGCLKFNLLSDDQLNSYRCSLISFSFLFAQIYHRRLRNISIHSSTSNYRILALVFFFDHPRSRYRAFKLIYIDFSIKKKTKKLTLDKIFESASHFDNYRKKRNAAGKKSHENLAL